MNRIVYKYSQKILKLNDKNIPPVSNQNITVTTLAPNYPIRRYINA